LIIIYFLYNCGQKKLSCKPIKFALVSNTTHLITVSGHDEVII